MKTANHTMAIACVELAMTLPISVVETLANCLATKTQGDWPTLYASAVENIALPFHRSLLSRFLDHWKIAAADVSPAAIATALLSAALVEKTHRDQHCTELVWTGPEVGIVPLRRTEQALLQLIESATRRLLIVSYAVYKIPRICEALI